MAVKKKAFSKQQSIVMELDTNLEKLMFTNGDPIVVTEDREKFQRIMEAFDSYEKEVISIYIYACLISAFIWFDLDW